MSLTSTTSFVEPLPRQPFLQQILAGVPLAEAVLSLQAYLLQPAFLDDFFARHRGRCYEDTLTFPTFVQLMADAVQKEGGRARRTLLKAKEQQRLPTGLEAFYGKLRRLPLALSQALVVETAARLRPVLPTTAVHAVPAKLAHLQVYAVDGKKLKKAAKRLLATRGHAGKLFGGKLLVAWQPTTNLAFAMSADLDGERNDAPLLPALLTQVAQALPGPRLVVADRQFCDLIQIERWQDNDDHFVLRYHSKVGFHADPAQPAQRHQDAQGRTVIQEWGWLGAVNHKRRCYVRRITLERPGEEAILLVTDLLDATTYPADDLLAVYLLRWRLECVFQQITEVFSLQQLIASTPQGTIFQAAFCLVWYNLIQVVRSYVATCQAAPVAVAEVSTEMLFLDVREELLALCKFVTPAEIVSLLPSSWTAEDLVGRLRSLLSGCWHLAWRKAVNKKPRRPTSKAKQSGAHTSVYRLQQKDKKPAAPG